MSFKKFLKDKVIYIIFLIFSVFATQTFLLTVKTNIYVRIVIGIIPIVLFSIAILIEYYTKGKYYKKISEKLEELDEKYLISELMEMPTFIEGEKTKEIIQETGKSMLENVNKYKYLQEDYKEYIELWIHEIKIPIATSKLIIENNPSEATKSINEELDKIENYIEQALYYARSNNVEKDYYIRKTNLKEIVNTAILKNKRVLLENKINLEIYNIEKYVYTDNKWCVFILNQIIQNSIKYSKKENKKIKIYAEEYKEKVILYIRDNGIGIKKGEISKVFEKGFTGENGRINGKKSTGLGLYLCKVLCCKLGLGIEINSEINLGTEIKIIFPKGSFISMS